METMSYIASLFAIFFGVCAPFWKKMRAILCLNFLTNVMTGVSYLLVGSYSGAAVAFLGGAQLVVNYVFNIKKGKIPTYVIVIHAAAFIAAGAFTFSAWYDILMLTASLLFVVSVAQNSSKYYRIIYFSNSAVLIVYDLLAGAYGNLMMHCMLLLSTVAAILIKDTKKKTC